MASLVFELESLSACSCPACWDPASGEVISMPAYLCVAWRRAAEEWLWASSLEDGSYPNTHQGCHGSIRAYRPHDCHAAALSEELWLMIFLFISDDCPLHSYTALVEISAVLKRAAAALAPRRAEHLRLLTINLEADHQLDVEMAREHELAEEADAFFETWSTDSDGHWHDRFERRWAE